MAIIRTPAKDFAVARFAADPDTWLANANEGFARGDEAVLQDIYDARAEQQRNDDGFDDWDDYLASGLTPLADQPQEQPILQPLGPRTIHPAWLRLALIQINQLDAVNAAVDSQGPEKQALWEYATTIAETDPDVNAIAAALNINLASVFDAAEAIRAARQPA